MTAPNWLTIRDGTLSKGLSERTWLINLGGRPQWRLDAVPAKGKFSCVVLQTTNARRLDQGKEYDNLDAALAGGLDELRANLGW